MLAAKQCQAVGLECIWSVGRINTLNQEWFTDSYGCKMEIRKMLDQETGEQAPIACSPEPISIRCG